MSHLSAVDLFAGCGGLSLGLKDSGVDVQWANEIDKHAAETYGRNHPGVRLVVDDVETFFQRLRDREAGLPAPGDVDLVAGGPPCQGFSGYNPYGSPDDPRNSLVERFLDVVAYLKPRYVLMENVPGLLAMQRGKVVEAIVAGLASVGFTSRLGIVQCGNFGVPQNRWRVFVWAAAEGTRVPNFPVPTHTFPGRALFGATRFREAIVRPPSNGPSLLWAPEQAVTVGDAIGDLPAIKKRWRCRRGRVRSFPVVWFPERGPERVQEAV